MGVLTKRSTVLGLPIGRQRFSWSRLAGVIGTTLAIVVGFVAAVVKGSQEQGSEETAEEQSSEESEGEGGADDDG